MENYKTIINPETGRKVSIYSKKGQSILNKYSQRGGAPYSSYSCVGFDKDECNDQPNGRCKWSDAGNYCRKTQSASKARGKRNWASLKKIQKEDSSNRTVANAFSDMGRQAEERRVEEEKQRRREQIEWEINEISTNISKAKADILSHSEEIEASQQYIDGLQRKLNELSKNISLAKGDISDHTEEIAASKQYISGLEKNKKALTKELTQL